MVSDVGKLQPQALDAEQAVLGALMLEKDAFSQINETLRPESFYDKRHVLIFEAIRELSNHPDGKVDVITVINSLKRSDNLEAAGGLQYVSQLTSNVTSTLHIDYHAKIVTQKHIARELIRYSGLIQGKAYDEGNDIEDVMQEAEEGLFEIAQRNIKRDAIQIYPVVEQAIKAIHDAKERTGGLSGLPSGFDEIDHITSGWQKSDLIIIAARPAMGKTAFVLSMAKNMAVNYKIPVAVFSLEMSNVQLVNRLIANVCAIENEKIKSGNLEPHEWTQLEVRSNDLYNAPIYIDDTAGLSIFELRTKARRLVREAKVQCIIIDYLQLMNAGERLGSRELEVSAISRSLKGLAKELDIPVIALSQLNRAVETREGRRPQLSDLRESGSIEQDADIVCFIHRPEVYGITEDANHPDLRGLAEVIVAKHRNGAIGEKFLKFTKELVKFDNLNAVESITLTSKVNDKPFDSMSSITPNDDFLTSNAGKAPY